MTDFHIWFGTNSGFNEYLNSERQKLFLLENTSHVNIFFGRNNSRKSRFLRELLLLNRYQVIDEKIRVITTEIVSLMETLKRQIDQSNKRSDSTLWSFNANARTFQKNPKLSELARKLETQDQNAFIFDRFEQVVLNVQKTIFGEASMDKDEDLQSPIEYLLNWVEYVVLYMRTLRLDRHISTSQHFDVLTDIQEQLNQYKSHTLKIISPNRVYIPAVRIARNIFGEHEQNYSSILKHDISRIYGIQESDKLSVYDGLDYYERVLKLRNSEKKKRQEIENFESFISSTFFDGKDVDIVADLEAKTLRILIEGDADRFLYDLGDGIQNLLILLYPLFTCDDKSWVFIEEPELNMHPGMQSLFIRTILSNKELLKKELKYFVVTHSNHLLDVGVDSDGVSFYTLSKNQDKSILTSVISNNNNILRELGVTNSSVLMSNSSIWIEGISDRLFLKALLKVYMKEKMKFVDSYHYNFFEYAGNNLVHYDFENESETEKIKAFFLANRIFLLADKDNGKEAKHKKLEEFSNGENFVYQNTISREIENLIPVKILKSFLVEKLFADRNRVNEYSMSYNDFENIGFGAYLEKLAIELKIRKKTYTDKKSKTGALNPYYKRILSEFIYEKCYENSTYNWEQIADNENTNTVIRNLYNFIKTNNK